jgi:quinol monooxygenase YgiN
MIALVATLRTNEGKDEQFEAVFREAMAAAKAEEPGCLLYQLVKSRTEPNTYKVLELYKDQDALSVHAKGEKMRAAFGKMGGLLAGRAEIDTLDAIV